MVSRAGGRRGGKEQRAELEEGEEWMTDIGADGDLQ